MSIEKPRIVKLGEPKMITPNEREISSADLIKLRERLEAEVHQSFSNYNLDALKSTLPIASSKLEEFMKKNTLNDIKNNRPLYLQYAELYMVVIELPKLIKQQEISENY